MDASEQSPVRSAVATLNPGYFAMVMATGIISVAMSNRGLTQLSALLLWITAVGWAVLVALYCWRAAAYAPAFRRDLIDARRSFAFFTFVAGTDVLGTRLALDRHRGVALALLMLAWAAWLVLGYVLPWLAVVARNERRLIGRANGTWFIWVVASESLAVLAAGLEPTTVTGRRELAVLAVFSWSVGVFLYAATGIFVAARLMVYPVRAADLSPPYWVAMGATAITVLAGARIVEMADAPMVDATRGLVAGTSVVFWAFGTWLIPVLVAAGWWRHVVHRIPLRYEASLWSVVFPLGMYGVAAYYLGRADHLPIVEHIGGAESWVALVAWTATFAAMLAHLARTLMLRPGRSR